MTKFTGTARRDSLSGWILGATLIAVALTCVVLIVSAVGR